MKISEIVKSGDLEGKEKHLPVIEVNDGIATVSVSKGAMHVSTAEHYIAWIRLYGVKKENNMLIDIAYMSFAPTCVAPKLTVELLASEYKELYAVSYCNIHGLWEGSLSL